MAREYTNQLLNMIEEGILDAEKVLRTALIYMTEAEVEDMAKSEGFIEEEEEEEEEEESNLRANSMIGTGPSF